MAAVAWWNPGMGSVVYLPAPASFTRRNGWRRPAPVRSSEAVVYPELPGPRPGIVIDVLDDFVHCSHPGCCALRPIGDDAACPACSRL